MAQAQTIPNMIDLSSAPAPPRWFEFLLEQGKLELHLETSGCDPSPVELITLFFKNIPITDSNNTIQSPPGQKNGNNSSIHTNGSNSSAPNGGNENEVKVPINELSATDKLIDYLDPAEVHIPPDSFEAKYRAKKAYSLQILAIKIASFLRWDMDVICNNLTIPVQYKLMQALTNACSSKNCPPEMKKFADIIYWHWFLRSAMTYRLSALQPQSNNTTIIYLSQLQQHQQAAESAALCSMGELFAPSSKPLKSCSADLFKYIWELTHNKDNSAKKMKGSGHPFKKAKLSRPTIDCFGSHGEEMNDWTKFEPVESKEFLEAACYDLGRIFFFEESYDMAKQTFELIKDSTAKIPKLAEYLKSASDILSRSEDDDSEKSENDSPTNQPRNLINARRQRTEKYLFDCMTQYSQKQKQDIKMEDEDDDSTPAKDQDLRFQPENNDWYLQMPLVQQQQLLEAAKGDVFMSQGNFKQAMGCFVGALMLITDYFRVFSKNYVEEEPYITRMIQCSISLSCFTQAVALCQMTKNLNYTIAFKQLNERVCNDCCDDIYECIWNVTLLEYIINLHSKRGEIERRTKVIQLIGQLELNENNLEYILKEAEHVRRGRFFRIMSNKYL